MYWVERMTPNIKKKLYMNTKMTNQFTDIAFNTSRNEKPQYRNFAGSKFNIPTKPNSVVEFKDFMGRTHLVQCKNNTEVKKQMKFFAELKKESLTISQIISSYPMKMGKIEKKFLSEVKKDLKSIGLNKRMIEIVLG
jgi:hypothetical protein